MSFKEKAIIELNEIIYNKKNKFTAADKERLIILRENIRRQKKKGLLSSAKEVCRLFGIHLGDEDDD